MSKPPLFTPPPAASRIHARLREAGHEAYFCGGCVRDALMGRTPKDYDITTSATPDDVETLFQKTLPVGKAFGVMIVVENGENYEVATFRTDMDYADGRHPTSVRFASAEEDVKRRDFTINALLYDPDKDTVIDYVGGEDDIKAGRLRTVGIPEDRFHEDHLRLLRAVRFAGRTGFAIGRDTHSAMRELAGLVRTVSGERVGTEMTRMLSEGYARYALELMADTGLLRHVLPEVDALRGMPQPKAFHPEGDVWTHTLIMLDLMDRTSADQPGLAEIENWRELLGWTVLLHDIGKPPTLSVSDRIRFNEHDKIGAEMAEAVLARMKRPNRTIDAVRDAIGRHMHFSALQDMRRSKRRRYLQEPMFALHLELHRLDCESSHRMLENYAFARESWTEEQARPPEPEPLLSGRDLIDMGYAPGPHMGEILSAVDDARLEGDINTTDDARAYVSEHFPKAP